MNFTALATVILATAFLATPTNAQSLTRAVYIEESVKTNEFEEKVRSALFARINATTRYVIGEAVNSELEISLVCLAMSDLIKGYTGGVCSYNIFYWPNELFGLSRALGPPVIISNIEPSTIAEDVFETMVSYSTEKALAKNLASMKTAIANYEADKVKSKP